MYCHGLIDKEVADRIGKPVWTVRTHKKHIYKKLGICTPQEIVLFMVARYLGREFNKELVRKLGIKAIL